MWKEQTIAGANLAFSVQVLNVDNSSWEAINDASVLH